MTTSGDMRAQVPGGDGDAADAGVTAGQGRGVPSKDGASIADGGLHENAVCLSQQTVPTGESLTDFFVQCCLCIREVLQSTLASINKFTSGIKPLEYLQGKLVKLSPASTRFRYVHACMAHKRSNQQINPQRQKPYGQRRSNKDKEEARRRTRRRVEARKRKQAINQS